MVVSRETMRGPCEEPVSALGLTETHKPGATTLPQHNEQGMHDQGPTNGTRTANNEKRLHRALAELGRRARWIARQHGARGRLRTLDQYAVANRGRSAVAVLREVTTPLRECGAPQELAEQLVSEFARDVVAITYGAALKQ